MAAPLFFLIPVIPVIAEFVQHVAEHNIGMYASLEAAAAMENHPVRMGFGYFKAFAMTCSWLWVPLYLAAGRRRMGLISGSSLRGFAKVLAFSVAIFAMTIVIGILMRRQGADATAILSATIASLLVGMVIEVLVGPWKIAAVIGDQRVSLARSISLAAPILPWGFALGLLATLPMMAVHYVLGAMMLFSGGEGAAFWGLVVADSIVVGVLTTLITAPAYYIYRRAWTRRGEAPEGAP